MSDAGKSLAAFIIGGIIGGSIGHQVGYNQQQAELQQTINQLRFQLYLAQQECTRLQQRNLELEAKAKNQKPQLN